MTKSIIKWIALSFINIAMLIISFILAPILPLFASSDGWLPNYLNWFQTPDNPLDGDTGWCTHFTWITNRYIRRVLWLFRNPCYGFDHTFLGRVIVSNMSMTTTGNPLTGNQPIIDGYVFRRMDNNGEILWQLYIVKGYTFFGNRCIRINLGWKLWGSLEIGQIKQYVFSINPWMKGDYE